MSGIKVKFFSGVMMRVIWFASAMSLLLALSSANSRALPGSETAGFLYSDYLQTSVFEEPSNIGFSVLSGEELPFWRDAFSRAREAVDAIPVTEYFAEELINGEESAILRTGESLELAGWNLGAELIEDSVSSFKRTRIRRADRTSSRLLRRVDVNIETKTGRGFTHAGIDVIGALHETDLDAVAWQFRGYSGFDNEDKRRGGNFGLIYRYSWVDALVGFNSFLDYETYQRTPFWRFSLGGEMRTEWLSLFGNYYSPLTDDEKTSDGLRLYTAGGYDVKVHLHSPNNPDISSVLGYYSWEGKYGNEEEKGVLLGMRYTPHDSPWYLELDYRSGEGEKVGGKATYLHEFGNRNATASHVREGLYAPRDYFFAPAEREYTQRIIVEKAEPNLSRMEVGSLNTGGVAILSGVSNNVPRGVETIDITTDLRLEGLPAARVRLDGIEENEERDNLVESLPWGMPAALTLTLSTEVETTVQIGWRAGRGESAVIYEDSHVILSDDSMNLMSGSVSVSGGSGFVFNGLNGVNVSMMGEGDIEVDNEVAMISGRFLARTGDFSYSNIGGEAEISFSYNELGAITLARVSSGRVRIIESTGTTVTLSAMSGGYRYLLSGSFGSYVSPAEGLFGTGEAPEAPILVTTGFEGTIAKVSGSGDAPSSFTYTPVSANSLTVDADGYVSTTERLAPGNYEVTVLITRGRDSLPVVVYVGAGVQTTMDGQLTITPPRLLLTVYAGDGLRGNGSSAAFPLLAPVDYQGVIATVRGTGYSYRAVAANSLAVDTSGVVSSPQPLPVGTYNITAVALDLRSGNPASSVVVYVQINNVSLEVMTQSAPDFTGMGSLESPYRLHSILSLPQGTPLAILRPSGGSLSYTYRIIGSNPHSWRISPQGRLLSDSMLSENVLLNIRAETVSGGMTVTSTIYFDISIGGSVGVLVSPAGGLVGTGSGGRPIRVPEGAASSFVVATLSPSAEEPGLTYTFELGSSAGTSLTVSAEGVLSATERLEAGTYMVPVVLLTNAVQEAEATLEVLVEPLGLTFSRASGTGGDGSQSSPYTVSFSGDAQPLLMVDTTGRTSGSQLVLISGTGLRVDDTDEAVYPDGITENAMFTLVVELRNAYVTVTSTVHVDVVVGLGLLRTQLLTPPLGGEGSAGSPYELIRGAHVASGAELLSFGGIGGSSTSYSHSVGGTLFTLTPSNRLAVAGELMEGQTYRVTVGTTSGSGASAETVMTTLYFSTRGLRMEGMILQVESLRGGDGSMDSPIIVASEHTGHVARLRADDGSGDDFTISDGSSGDLVLRSGDITVSLGQSIPAGEMLTLLVTVINADATMTLVSTLHIQASPALSATVDVVSAFPGGSNLTAQVYAVNVDNPIVTNGGIFGVIDTFGGDPLDYRISVVAQNNDPTVDTAFGGFALEGGQRISFVNPGIWTTVANDASVSGLGFDDVVFLISSGGTDSMASSLLITVNMTIGRSAIASLSVGGDSGFPGLGTASDPFVINDLDNLLVGATLGRVIPYGGGESGDMRVYSGGSSHLGVGGELDGDGQITVVTILESGETYQITVSVVANTTLTAVATLHFTVPADLGSSGMVLAVNAPRGGDGSAVSPIIVPSGYNGHVASVTVMGERSGTYEVKNGAIGKLMFFNGNITVVSGERTAANEMLTLLMTVTQGDANVRKVFTLYVQATPALSGRFVTSLSQNSAGAYLVDGPSYRDGGYLGYIELSGGDPLSYEYLDIPCSSAPSFCLTESGHLYMTQNAVDALMANPIAGLANIKSGIGSNEVDLVLTLTLDVSTAPATVFGLSVEPSSRDGIVGLGTADDPFVITDLEHIEVGRELALLIPGGGGESGDMRVYSSGSSHFSVDGELDGFGRLTVTSMLELGESYQVPVTVVANTSLTAATTVHFTVPEALGAVMLEVMHAPRGGDGSVGSPIMMAAGHTGYVARIRASGGQGGDLTIDNGSFGALTLNSGEISVAVGQSIPANGRITLLVTVSEAGGPESVFTLHLQAAPEFSAEFVSPLLRNSNGNYHLGDPYFFEGAVLGYVRLSGGDPLAYTYASSGASFLIQMDDEGQVMTAEDSDVFARLANILVLADTAMTPTELTVILTVQSGGTDAMSAAVTFTVSLDVGTVDQADNLMLARESSYRGSGTAVDPYVITDAEAMLVGATLARVIPFGGGQTTMSVQYSSSSSHLEVGGDVQGEITVTSMLEGGNSYQIMVTVVTETTLTATIPVHFSVPTGLGSVILDVSAPYGGEGTDDSPIMVAAGYIGHVATLSARGGFGGSLTIRDTGTQGGVLTVSSGNITVISGRDVSAGDRHGVILTVAETLGSNTITTVLTLQVEAGPELSTRFVTALPRTDDGQYLVIGPSFRGNGILGHLEAMGGDRLNFRHDAICIPSRFVCISDGGQIYWNGGIFDPGVGIPSVASDNSIVVTMYAESGVAVTVSSGVTMTVNSRGSMVTVGGGSLVTLETALTLRILSSLTAAFTVGVEQLSRDDLSGVGTADNPYIITDVGDFEVGATLARVRPYGGGQTMAVYSGGSSHLGVDDGSGEITVLSMLEHGGTYQIEVTAVADTTLTAAVTAYFRVIESAPIDIVPLSGVSTTDPGGGSCTSDDDFCIVPNDGRLEGAELLTLSFRGSGATTWEITAIEFPSPSGSADDFSVSADGVVSVASMDGLALFIPYLIRVTAHNGGRTYITTFSIRHNIVI